MSIGTRGLVRTLRAMVLNVVEAAPRPDSNVELFAKAVNRHMDVASQYRGLAETRELKTAVEGLLVLGRIGYANDTLRSHSLNAFAAASQFATFHAGTRQSAVTGLIAIAQDAFIRQDWATAHRAMQPAQKYVLGTGQNRSYAELYQDWVAAGEPAPMNPAVLLFQAASAEDMRHGEGRHSSRNRVLNAVLGLGVK